MLHLRILLNLRKSGKPCSRKARSVSGQAGAVIGFSPPIVGFEEQRLSYFTWNPWHTSAENSFREFSR